MTPELADGDGLPSPEFSQAVAMLEPKGNVDEQRMRSLPRFQNKEFKWKFFITLKTVIW